MIQFIEATAVSAIALLIALVLGRLVHAHPRWWVYSSEWASTTLAVILTTAFATGFVGASVACVEQGLSSSVWMPVYVLVMVGVAVLVRAAFALPRFRAPTSMVH